MHSIDKVFEKNLNPEIQKVLDHSQEFIKGSSENLFNALCCFLSEGHLLIEDVPGVGKTTLVKYMAKALGLKMSRIQFTNDLLPSDIIGSKVYSKQSESFTFHQGPLFGEIILADELNRATPKTQSALLQSMEEKKISLDGEEFQLPDDYFVVATQNPHGQMGTFPLPESQIDRFMMKLSLGYLSEEASVELFAGGDPNEKIQSIAAVINKEGLSSLKNQIKETHCSKELLSYIYRLLECARNKENMVPLSTRTGMDLTSASKTIAFLYGRDFVTPEDVQQVFPYVAGHRLTISQNSGRNHEISLAKSLLDEVSVR